MAENGQPFWRRWWVIAIGVVLIVGFIGGLLGDDDEAPTATVHVNVADATAEVDTVLLGENWTGSGSYTILKAGKAYNSAGDFTVYATKINSPGAEGLVLFWRADGSQLTDGLIIGDIVTREFSVWGAAASPGSPIDDQVEIAKISPEGQAVLAFVC